MSNWMEKFEREKDEARERELYGKLKHLLELLDEAYKDEDRVKIIRKIIEVYDALKIEACDYDENDYKTKKQELADTRYEIMREKHMADKDSKSWNEYKNEELEKEEELDR